MMSRWRTPSSDIAGRMEYLGMSLREFPQVICSFALTEFLEQNSHGDVHDHLLATMRTLD